MTGPPKSNNAAVSVSSSSFACKLPAFCITKEIWYLMNGVDNVMYIWWRWNQYQCLNPKWQTYTVQKKHRISKSNRKKKKISIKTNVPSESERARKKKKEWDLYALDYIMQWWNHLEEEKSIKFDTHVANSPFFLSFVLFVVSHVEQWFIYVNTLVWLRVQMWKRWKNKVVKRNRIQLEPNDDLIGCKQWRVDRRVLSWEPNVNTNSTTRKLGTITYKCCGVHKK